MSYIKRIYDLMDDLDSLTPQEFESLVIDILKEKGRFTKIESYADSGGKDLGIDIVGAEYDPVTKRENKWFVQVKKTDLTSVDTLRFLRNYVVHNPEYSYSRILFVTSGTITKEAKEYLEHSRIEVWTAHDLYQFISPQLKEKYFRYTATAKKDNVQESEERALAFKKALNNIKPGQEMWSSYQKLTSDIFEYLFCPPLETPRYELFDADEKNRRDMIFENSSDNGFWKSLKETYQADYIVVDAKNYCEKIDKKPILEIAHYLKPYGCGMFGIIITRKGTKESAYHAMREQWIGSKKMIMAIDDLDIIQMLDIHTENGKPEELIRKKLADFRMKL